jgi:hypothetical protein
MNGYNISQSRFTQTNSPFIISIINAHITVYHHHHQCTHITPRKHRKRISSTHQQRRKITSGGSGSTRREAIEEKEMKMKRWRGIESICFRLNKRRNRAWVCCVLFTETKQNVLFGLCEKNTANLISVKKA